jgi:hypothetical protein
VSFLDELDYLSTVTVGSELNLSPSLPRAAPSRIPGSERPRDDASAVRCSRRG